MTDTTVAERVARLERGESETSGDIVRVERKLDSLIESVGQMRGEIQSRKGLDGAVAWLLDGMKLLLAAGGGAALIRLAAHLP